MGRASTLAGDEVRRLRLRAQSLHPRDGGVPPGGSGAAAVVGTVRRLVGVQAQVPQSAALCVRARTTGLSAADVDAALLRERGVVRAWAMRGTLHLVAAEDLGWLLSLLEPVLRAASARRYRELNLTEDDLSTGVRVLRDALATHGPLVRRDLAEHLLRHGIDPSGQRLIHLVSRAALQGVLCHGPDMDGDPSYVLCDDWLGPGWAGAPRSREAALAELAHRYLVGYGPAGPRDLAAWSGLTVRESRTAWRLAADRMVQVRVDGEPAALAAAGPSAAEPSAGGAEPLVRLLPGFDAYLLGYRSRDLSVPADHARAVWTGGGWIKPTLTVDGWTVATWTTERRRGRTAVVVRPFGTLDADATAGLDAEVADLGRFLGVPTMSLVTHTPRR
jgi:hypothetical protein